MRGIVLAGGLGTRLYPVTRLAGKQLLPIYDKPMIYYPLSILMQASIREILIIALPSDIPKFKSLLGDGSKLGITLSYAPQPIPKGIADALLVARTFIENRSVALILGDNIFHGDQLIPLFRQCRSAKTGGSIFGYRVEDPKRYGVIALDAQGEAVDIVEKPLSPPSSYAVTGLYFYDSSVVEIAQALTPSQRGELEISDVNRAYLEQGKLTVHLLQPGCTWLDTGTFEGLLQASNYVYTLQKRQKIQIGCLEEVAYKQGWITTDQLLILGKEQEQSDYGQYLLSLPSLYSAGLLSTTLPVKKPY